MLTHDFPAPVPDLCRADSSGCRDNRNASFCMFMHVYVCLAGGASIIINRYNHMAYDVFVRQRWATSELCASSRHLGNTLA